MRLSELIDLARITAGDPREGWRRIAALGLGRSEVWTALLAVVALSGVMAELTLVLMAPGVARDALPFPGPFAFALMQLVVFGAAAGLIARVGGWLGGQGSFEDALLALAWLQAILILVQLVQMLTVLVLPSLSVLIGLAALGLFFWVLAGLVAELHGFSSIPRTLAGLIVGMFGLIIALSLLIAVLGIEVVPLRPDV